MLPAGVTRAPGSVAETSSFEVPTWKPYDSSIRLGKNNPARPDATTGVTGKILLTQ